jgi:membrane protein implicated in regulation of membrane protease activity
MRWILIGIAILYLAIGAILLIAGLSGWLVAWTVFEACILLAALLLERWRYRPPINRRSGKWERTGERFVDPATGRVTEVFYNPDTGERDYVEVGQDPR